MAINLWKSSVKVALKSQAVYEIFYIKAGIQLYLWIKVRGVLQVFNTMIINYCNESDVKLI